MRSANVTQLVVVTGSQPTWVIWSFWMSACTSPPLGEFVDDGGETLITGARRGCGHHLASVRDARRVDVGDVAICGGPAACLGVTIPCPGDRADCRG